MIALSNTILSCIYSYLKYDNDKIKFKIAFPDCEIKIILNDVYTSKQALEYLKLGCYLKIGKGSTYFDSSLDVYRNQIYGCCINTIDELNIINKLYNEKLTKSSIDNTDIVYNNLNKKDSNEYMEYNTSTIESTVKNDILINKCNTINIAILGPVSAGKSTFLNSLFVKQYSDMKIKRTTMTPQVYLETNNLQLSDSEISKIREANTIINNDLISKTENNAKLTYDDINNTIEYNVPRVYNMHNLDDDTFLKIYDIPGLNDSRTAEHYFKYIDNNFIKWNIIIFVVDINSGMNTDDEVKILNKIINNAKINYDNYGIVNKLFIIANKVDDLERCPIWGLKIIDDEYVDMYNQIKKHTSEIIKIKYPELEYYILPMSAEDAFIYRMYDLNIDADMDMKHLNKLGHNEFGKSRWNKFSLIDKKDKIKQLMQSINIQDNLDLTGFNYFKKLFNDILESKYQYTYLMNHIIVKCKVLLDKYINEYILRTDNKDDINVYYTKFLDIYNNILHLNNKYTINNLNIEYNGLYKFYKYFTIFIKIHMYSILNIKYNTTINVTNENIFTIEMYKKHLHNVITNYNDEYKLLNNIETDIINKINSLYVNNIKEQILPFNILFTQFQKLYDNNYNIDSNIIINLFTHNDILNDKPTKIISYFEYMLTTNLITKDNLINSVESLLFKIYDNIRLNINMTYIDNISEYVYFAEIFWRKYTSIYINNITIHHLEYRAKQNSNLKINTMHKMEFNFIDIFNKESSIEAYYISLL
jgi:predicted GTPase